MLMVILIGNLSLTSCSNDELVEDNNLVQKNSPSHRLTAEQAAQNVLKFVLKLNGTTRSTAKQIAEIKAISMPGTMTRSGNGEAVSLDSLFYVVNFTNDQGFAVAAADDRSTPVYAYVEEGNYSGYIGEEENPGFAAFMNALIEQEIYDRLYGNGGGDSGDDGDSEPTDGDEGGGGGTYLADRFIVQSPLLVTRWGQQDIYGFNYFCPEGCPTGCVPTAMAQICSYMEAPNAVSWGYNGTYGSSTLDWSAIKMFSFPYGESQYQVAHLMRFLGNAFDADYTPDGTGVDGDDAINAMRNMGFNVSNLVEYDAMNVMETLSQGDRIIYMQGFARYYHVGLFFRNYVDGHAWVVDGYIDQVEHRERSIFIHCNWGWYGSRNGYFLSNVLNAEQNPVFNDDGTRSYNYRYKLKTATFIK